MCFPFAQQEQSQVCLLPPKSSHCQFAHHILTLWFTFQPLLGEYSTTYLWYRIDRRGKHGVLTSPLVLKMTHSYWL